MGNLVIPKHTAENDYFIASLIVLEKQNDWIDLAKFTNLLFDELRILGREKERVDDNTHYTKCLQLPCYYGFAESDELKSQSKKRITENGIKFLKYYRENNTYGIWELFLESFQKSTFGRNNSGCITSDSDYEAPNIFIKASLMLAGLTRKEYAYILWELDNNHRNFEGVIIDIMLYRNQHKDIILNDGANKYKDPKIILSLENWQLLVTESGKTVINPLVIKKYSNILKELKIMNNERKIEMEQQQSDKDVHDMQKEIIPTPHTSPIQKIFYGVPGCGKSHKISEMLEDKNIFNITSEENQIVRTVFHPDYTNADFVGQILPEVKGDKIEYNFKEGPFTEILAKALLHPENQYVLIIEEINRGNSAAIFGEIFQLLDRIENGVTSVVDGVNKFGKGWSEYFFMNDLINEYVRKMASPSDNVETSVQINGITFTVNTGIRLPPNLSLLATMNTSDQNVFTLDNAFQRRWDMEYISNRYDESKANEKQKAQYNSKIGSTEISWGKFRDAINKEISNPENSFANAEDKQLGLFFIKAENNVINESDFSNKVLKYLWNDIFKRDKSIFNDDVSTFGDLLEAFNGADAFEKSFSSDFLSKISE